jgi:hypothetical protein
MNIEMTGYADVRADAKTVKDLRDLVSFLDENRVRDDAQIDWGSGYVYILVADNARADFIECGDHIPPDLEFDVILSTHDHDEDDDGDEEILCNRCGGKDSDNTYHLHRGEYFCVPCYGKPAKYDWPAIDRYGDEARPE